uniref:Kelch domain-containing protein 3 n=1 Tax=Phallusia mammillata TaxID=59560 RepID=A0A6F9DGL5_9ASCI|nr:kelch domain-containing protein 3 [Phallusia mammillata]
MLPRWTVSLEGGPRRVNHSSALIGHRIFMFGGYCMGVNYEVISLIDVHVFNTYTYRWARIPTEKTTFENIAHVPYMRYGHASVAIDNKVYLWGGRNDSFGACNVLHCFNTGKLHWKKVPLKGTYPGARDGHAMCVVNSKIYIFGGYEQEADCFSNQMFMIDLKEKMWHFIQAKGGIPASWRDFHTITSHGDLIYVFGGRGDVNAPMHSNRDIYDNTLKVFNTKTCEWSNPVNPTSIAPLGRRSHSAFMHGGCLYIFCGYNGEIDQHFNCLWKFDPDISLWSKVKTVGTLPMARRRQCCCIHDNRLFMFGGTSPVASSDYYAADNSFFIETDDTNLQDHSDTHVLDFNPSLKTLCILSVIKHRLNMQTLPPKIRSEIRMMTTPNTISRSLSQG